MRLTTRNRAFGLAGTLAGMLLASCGGSAGPSSNPTSNGASASAVAAALASVVPAIPTIVPSSSANSQPQQLNFTNQNWGQAVLNPARFKGSTVDITGQVINVEEDATRYGIQIWTDPLRGEGNTVVVFPKQGFPTVHKSDSVEVQGTLDEVFTGKNDSGQSLTLPHVTASAVKIVKAAPISGTGSSPSPSAAAPASSAGASPVSSPSSSPAAAPSASSSANTSAAASAGASPTASAAGTPYRVAGSGAIGLAVRSGPSTAQTKLGVVHDGEIIDVVSQSAGWAKVQGDGFSGYSSMAYLVAAPTAASQPLAKLSPST
ncbi:MAG: SH3 domain-containing protein [Chloroflexi bacterium]|nr:SH3 domain-containing protein [Chloroflexota bacterium]